MITLPFRVACVLMAFCMVAGAAAWNIGAQAFRPVVVYSEFRRSHDWDLTDPWERCLAAMEQAEIPGDMWECHEPK